MTNITIMLQKYYKNVAKWKKMCYNLTVQRILRGDNYDTIEINIYFIIYNGWISWICCTANKTCRHEY